MNRPSYVAFDSGKYREISMMWQDIATLCSILTKNNYVCVVRYDDCGIYMVEYGYDDEAMGTLYPYWLTPDQYETVNFGDEENE